MKIASRNLIKLNLT